MKFNARCSGTHLQVQLFGSRHWRVRSLSTVSLLRERLSVVDSLPHQLAWIWGWSKRQASACVGRVFPGGTDSGRNLDLRRCEDKALLLWPAACLLVHKSAHHFYCHGCRLSFPSRPCFFSLPTRTGDQWLSRYSLGFRWWLWLLRNPASWSKAATMFLASPMWRQPWLDSPDHTV